MEHLTAVEENDDHRGDGKQEAIPGLSIGENRVHDVQVIQDGDQQAAARGVEQRGHDDRNGDQSEEEGTKRPGALRRPTQQRRQAHARLPKPLPGAGSPKMEKIDVAAAVGQARASRTLLPADQATGIEPTPGKP